MVPMIYLVLHGVHVVSQGCSIEHNSGLVLNTGLWMLFSYLLFPHSFPLSSSQKGWCVGSERKYYAQWGSSKIKLIFILICKCFINIIHYKEKTTVVHKWPLLSVLFSSPTNTLILGIWLPEQENESVFFQAAKFVVIARAAIGS